MDETRISRWFSPAVFTAIALAFLLPFATVSCDSEEITVRGVQLAFAQVPGDSGGDSLGRQIEDEATPWAFVALGAAVVGAALGFAGRRGGGIAAANGLLAMLVLVFQLLTTLATVDTHVGFELVLVGYLVVATYHAVKARRRRRALAGSDAEQKPRSRRRLAVTVALCLLALTGAGGCGAAALTGGGGDDFVEPEPFDFYTADADPAWSPDGTTIAFTRGSGVHTINADGSCRRRLSAGGEPAWSPSGERLAVTRCKESTCRIVIASRDGKDERELVKGPFFSPVWASDGRRVFLSREDDDNITQTWVVNADGTGLRQLTHAWVDRTDPRWSIAATSEDEPTFAPDASQYAFGSSDDPTVGIDALQDAIFVRDVRGGDRRRLSDPPGNSGDYEPAWAPDSGRIAFQRGGEIAVMDADGSDERVLTQVNGATDPAWAPDSARIVFTRELHGGGFSADPSVLMIVDVESGDVRKLTWGPRPVAPCRAGR